MSPDIVCVGKGLDGRRARALCDARAVDRVYDAFLGEPGRIRPLLSRLTRTPAIRSRARRRWRRSTLFDEEGTLERARASRARVARAPGSLRAHPLVRDVRQAGTMIGIELRGEAIDPRRADAGVAIATALRRGALHAADRRRDPVRSAALLDRCRGRRVLRRARREPASRWRHTEPSSVIE